MTSLHILWRWLGAGILALGLTGPAWAQDFVLPYNKTPETAPEFWAAAKFDMSLGNHNRSAQMFGNFYDKVMGLGEEEQRKYFLNMYDSEGVSPLLKLSTIPAVKQVMRKDPATGKDRAAVEILIGKMTGFIEARLSDPDRIRFFVGQLNKRPEERAYAITQLRASGARSVPAMLDILRDPAQQPLHGPVYTALLKMDSDIGPPLLAALDSKSEFLRSTIVDVFAHRADSRIIPDLYHLSAANSSSQALKDKAKSWLNKFLGSAKETLDPRAALVAEAEKYHKHQVDLSGQKLGVWTWNDQSGLAGQPADASRVEEQRGINYARKALDLDPSYRSAQVTLLSIALDKLYERGGPSVSVAKAAPELQALLAGSPADLLEEVLAKALKNGRTNTVLGAVKALGAHGDPKLLRMSEKGAPPLLQALRYPDRRVQLAAAESVLAVPNTHESYPGSSRVVDVLKTAVTGSGAAKALVGLGNRDESSRIAGLLRPIGFEAHVAASGSELLEQAASEGNVALVITDAALPNPGFGYFLAQYKNNAGTAGIPLLIVAEKEQARLAQEATRHLPNVRIISSAPASGDLLKAEVGALVSDRTKPAVSDAERLAQAKTAVESLARIANGELKGYDLRSADSALIKAANDDALTATAASVLSYRPSREAQNALASLVLSESKSPALRVTATAALRAHLQRFGNQLTPEQTQGLFKLALSATDPALREQADLTAASLKADAAAFGARLKGFVPGAAPSAPAVKVEPGKEGN